MEGDDGCKSKIEVYDEEESSNNKREYTDDMKDLKGGFGGHEVVDYFRGRTL